MPNLTYATPKRTLGTAIETTIWNVQDYRDTWVHHIHYKLFLLFCFGHIFHSRIYGHRVCSIFMLCATWLIQCFYFLQKMFLDVGLSVFVQAGTDSSFLNGLITICKTAILSVISPSNCAGFSQHDTAHFSSNTPYRDENSSCLSSCLF